MPLHTTGGVTKKESKRTQVVGALKSITISDLKLFEVAEGCSLSGTIATPPSGLVCPSAPPLPLARAHGRKTLYTDLHHRAGGVVYPRSYFSWCLRYVRALFDPDLFESYQLPHHKVPHGMI
jgi:hypothetical protein